MGLWVDVFLPNGVKIGDGPIDHVRSAQTTRILDSAGDFSFEVPGSDGRALDLLQPERRVVVYVEQFGKVREFCRGIIRDIAYNDGEGGKNLNITGPDILNELASVNTFYDVLFNNVAAMDIVETAVAFATEWSILAAETKTTTLGFDGASVLTIIRETAKAVGRHWRLEDARTILFGAMGDDSGLHIYQQDRGGNTYDNQEIATITRLEYRRNSEKIVNMISPVGAKDAGAYIGLQYYFSYPFYLEYVPQQFTSPFVTVYFIEASDSIEKYGEKQAVVSFPNIRVVGGGFVNASFAVYQAAVEYLKRNKDPQSFYSCTIKNVKKVIRPGQRIHLMYKGEAVGRDGRTYNVDIDNYFWVLRVSERFDQGGLTVDLELSDIDQTELTEGEMVANLMEEVNRLEPG